MKARLVGVVCAGLAVALMASVSSAAVLFTVDTQINLADPGAGVHAIDAHDAQATLGQTVNLNVYLKITGTSDSDPSNDGVTTLYGALKSTDGNLQGNLSFTPASVLASALNQPGGAQSGTVQSLDNDADMDVGGKNTQSGADWIFLFAGASVFAPMGAGDQLLIGTATFTVTNSDPNSTNVGWVYRNKTGLSNTIDAFKVDGVTAGYTLAGNSSMLGAVTSNISIPEPATMAILTLGGLGLIIRRKKA